MRSCSCSGTGVARGISTGCGFSRGFSAGFSTVSAAFSTGFAASGAFSTGPATSAGFSTATDLISRISATRLTLFCLEVSFSTSSTRSPAKACSSRRSQETRIISASRKRTSSLLGWTLTSTPVGGITRFSTHMGYMPMVTRPLHTASSARDKSGQRTERPLMKNI